jgi:hypothetical protein
VTTKNRTRNRPGRQATIAAQPDCDIPFETPAPLPPGLHVAPFLSWTGKPLLLVIDDKGEEELLIDITEVRSVQHEDGFYEFPFLTPKWLGEVARPWHRGVWRSPFTVRGGWHYLAVDAHGRLVNVQYWHPKANLHLGDEPKTEAEAVANCRAALRAEDPVVRSRPLNETRW